jgi:hypothetical protein
MRIGDKVKVTSDSVRKLEGKTGVIQKPGDDSDWFVEMIDVEGHPKLWVPFMTSELAVI